jgi:hypothetical protein
MEYGEIPRDNVLDIKTVYEKDKINALKKREAELLEEVRVAGGLDEFAKRFPDRREELARVRMEIAQREDFLGASQALGKPAYKEHAGPDEQAVKKEVNDHLENENLDHIRKSGFGG